MGSNFLLTRLVSLSLLVDIELITSSHSSVPESTSPADGGSCLCQGWSGACYLHLHVHLLHHHLLVDQDLEMRCAFELEGENLYSIKWFQVGLIIIVIMIMTMAYQHIPTSHIPTWWEHVIMMKGGNMTQSYSQCEFHTLYKSIIS